MENPWELIRTRHFNIFPEDEWTVRQHNQRCKNKPELQVQQSLLPLPYVGNPAIARVILLGKNSSYSDVDDTDAERLPALVAENEKALTFESAFPFFYLDPQFANTNGFAWWSQVLIDVLDACAVRGSDWETTASRIACVQQHPYRSKKTFDLEPPSATQPFTLHLADQAAARGAVFVMQYGDANARWWNERMVNLPADYIRLNSSQTAKLSRRNMSPGDFDRLIGALVG